MKFKIGDWVRCIDDNGLIIVFKGGVYEVVDRNTDENTIAVQIRSDDFASLASYRFEIFKRADETLSDFQKLRLETALRMWQQYEDGNGIKYALEAADELINLVLSTPFKPTND